MQVQGKVTEIAKLARRINELPALQMALPESTFFALREIVLTLTAVRTKATLRRGSVLLLLICGESAGYSRMVCTISVTTARTTSFSIGFWGKSFNEVNQYTFCQ
jgi:hypothetical protein